MGEAFPWGKFFDSLPQIMDEWGKKFFLRMYILPQVRPQ